MRKSLETECNNLKEILNKTQCNQRDLNTSCLILFGLLKSVLSQNLQLKQERKTFEMIYFYWNELSIKLKADLNAEIESKEGNNNNKANNKDIAKNLNDKFELADAVDYSLSSSLISSSSSCLKTDSFMSLPNAMKKNSKALVKLPSKLCIFRRAVIGIIAVNRFIYLHNINKNSNILDSNKNNFKFLYSNNCVVENKFTLKSSNNNIKQSSTPNITNQLKDLLEWLTLTTENNSLIELNNVSNELNKHLYFETGNY